MSHLNTFENFRDKVINTNRWKYTIKIKYLLTNDDISLPTEENKQKIDLYSQQFSH